MKTTAHAQGRPPSTGSVPSEHPAWPEHADNEKKHDCAYGRDQKAAPESGESDAKRAGDKCTEECADDADNEIGDQTVFAAHHLFRDPAGEDADHDRADD